MKVALDSNVLVYLAGGIRDPKDVAKVETARRTIEALRTRCKIVVPTQVAGELFSVLRKIGWEDDLARRTVLDLAATGTLISASWQTFASALDLAVDHRLQFWDSLILSAAAEAGCDLLLSEDMQNGFVFRGMTIANPFSSRLVPRLSALLEQ